MNKQTLLSIIAENGYNVGFGAKKTFATFDIVEKVPNLLGLIIFIVGVIQLRFPGYKHNNDISVILICISAAVLYINFYNTEKSKYEKVGIEITEIYYHLRDIYYSVKNSSEENFDEQYKEVKEIMNKFYEISITKQILFSDWYAHYKFFVQMQYEWINEQKKFSLFKDMIPKSLIVVLIFSVAFIVIFVVVL